MGKTRMSRRVLPNGKPPPNSLPSPLVFLDGPFEKLANLFAHGRLINETPHPKLVTKLLGYLISRYTYSFHTFHSITQVTRVSSGVVKGLCATFRG